MHGTMNTKKKDRAYSVIHFYLQVLIASRTTQFQNVIEVKIVPDVVSYVV